MHTSMIFLESIDSLLLGFLVRIGYQSLLVIDIDYFLLVVTIVHRS